MDALALTHQIAAMKHRNDDVVGFRVTAPPGLEVSIEPLMVPGDSLPAIGGSAALLPGVAEADSRTDALFDLRHSPEAESKGSAILQMVRDAVRDCARGGDRPDPKAIRTLARLVEVKPEFAYRVPEFDEYLRWLTERGAATILARIVGHARTGRPRESYLFLVALIDRIQEREDCSVAKAAAIARKRYPQLLPLSVESIRNRYSEARELYRAVNGTQYASAAGLLPYTLP
jgi:hypothetical protein